MRKLIYICFFLVWVCGPVSSYAVAVHSIYRAEIPVASQSTQLKNSAIIAGLAQVLTKVSGNMNIIEDNPGLKTLLEHPVNSVQQLSYSPTKDKTDPFLLKIQYEPKVIEKALKEIGAPVWQQDRPLMLMWLALETPDHPLDIVDSSTPGMQELVKAASKARGLPVILPMLDVTELGQVKTDDILHKSIPNLQHVSQRYQSDALLIGYIHPGDTELNSQWHLIMGPDQWSWDVSGKSVSEVMTTIMANVGDTLAGKFAQVSDTVQAQITLNIDGVSDQQGFMQLMQYLQHLAPVREVQLNGIHNNLVTLNIDLRNNKQAFLNTLNTEKKLKLTSSLNNSLQYTWTQ